MDVEWPGDRFDEVVGIGLDKMTPTEALEKALKVVNSAHWKVLDFFLIKVSNMFRPSFESEAASSEAFAFEKNGEPVAKARDRL